MLLSLCWGCSQYTAAMCPYLLLPPLLVICSENHTDQQQENKHQTSRLLDRDTKAYYGQAAGSVSRTGKQQAKLPSSLCCWYWISTCVHNVISWIVLGPNLARKDIYPSWDSSHITVQCVPASCTVPACVHRNLSIEVFGQDVHLFLRWPPSLPIQEWQPLQLGWCACPNTSSRCYHSESLPFAYWHIGEEHATCTSYFIYHLIVHYTHQGLYISSLNIKQEPQVNLSQDLQVEPTLLLLFSSHSKLLSIPHKIILLSWRLLPVSAKEMDYRLMAVKGRGIWSTFYNPYALQNNYYIGPIPQHSRKEVVASIFFSTEKSAPGELSGEVGYTNFTLSLTSKSELPTYFTFNTQKIKTGTYFFSRTQGLYYSTEEGNAANTAGNLSNICYIFYQQQSLSYLITIESFQLHWYKFNINLYLNRRGALLKSFSQKDIEIYIFNSGPSFLQSLAYVVWFIPLQHPLLQQKWTFNLQLFDSRREYLLQNDTFTYKDRFRNAAHFIPQSTLPFNPALYAGFVAKTNCTRSGRKHAILNATVNSYTSKFMETTVACLQIICFIKRVKIQKPDPTHSALNYSKREPFTLSAVTQMNCPTPKRKDVIWKIYKVPDMNTAPDWSNPFNPPGIGRRNRIMLEVPGSSLDYGLYLFNFTVKLTTLSTLESVEGSDSVFVEIGARNLVAIIAGGNLQTVSFTSHWTLDGSASSDPDAAQPFEGLTFTWYCTKQKADYELMILSEKGKCHPEQVDLKWTASSNPIQTVQPKTLQENAVYYFLLVVRKGSRTAYAKQMVHVRPSPALVLNVTCIENCGTSVIPMERFCLSGQCLNCRKSSRPFYHWSLFSESSTEKYFDWDSKTTTGRANSYICIKPLSFVNMMEQSYMLVLKMITQQNESSVYNYSFSVNSPPLLGKCVLNPTRGMALVTKFIVSCSGFKGKNLPLTYKVKAALDTLNISRMTSTEDMTLGTIVYFGYQSKIPPSFLPVGIPSKQYALTVYVEVYDALGAYSQTTLQTTVYGSIKGQQADIFLNELHNLVSGPTAPIATFLKNGNYFRASYFIYIVASALNDIDILQRFHSSKTELREVLLNRSAGIPTTSVMEANQMISSIFQITQEVTEVNRKSQLLAIKKLREVTEELKKYSNKDLGSKEREILGTAIFAGLSNVLKASLLEHRNIHRNGIKETIYMTEILADLILQGKVPGENETIMEAKDWTITLRKNEKWDVSDEPSRRDGKNYFYSKMKQEDNDELPGDAVVSTVLYEFDNNPFPWLPYADDISTMVTGFKITGTKSNGDMIGIVPNIAEMILTRKDEKTNVTFELMIRRDKNLPKATGKFSVEILRQSKNIFIQIVPKRKVAFQIFIYPGLTVSCAPIATFNVSYNKPSVTRGKNSNDNDCAFKTPYMVCLSQTLLRSLFQGRRATKLNVSVVLQSPAWDQDTQLVGIRLFTAECLYLDGVESHWKEGFCHLGPLTSWEKVHCICSGKKRISRTANPQLRRASRNDVTFLAGKITAYSNSLDTKENENQSTQIHKNPVTLVTVAFVFVFYIVLAIWSMRKDRADMKSTDHAIVLPDNDPFDKVCYLVTVYTGSRLGAGTTADVFIQLIGERSVSDVHCLRHPEYLTFFRGSINTFLVTSKKDLGDIYCLRAFHNNEGTSPNWFLSRIKVENMYTKKSWMFMCRKWFALDKEDGLIERIFIVAHPKAPLNKLDFFLISFANDVADSHLWLSIFAHVCTGSLNRLQRLSCCLTILLCILLLNIMFFSADKDQQMFSEHLQYLRSIIIGVQGAFLSIPLQMIVTAFFRYSQEETLIQDTTQTLPREGCAFMSGNLTNWKERLQKWYLIETASKDPGHLFQEVSSNISESHKVEQSKQIRWRQTGKKWTNCTISEGDANVIATEDDMPQDANINNNLNNNYLENHIPYSQTRSLNIDNMVFRKRPPIKRTPWNGYVLWMLVLVISPMSSFFIILYGLPLDYEASLEWLAASAISLWVNVFLLQTVNIAIFSALKTLYPKNCKSLPWSSKETYIEIKLSDIDMDADDMRELHYDLVRMRGTKEYHPLEEDEITICKKRQKIQHQAFVFIKDVVCHFVFLILILNIAYSMENTTSFYYNLDIHNKFSQGLSHVNKVDDIYTWLRKVFLPLIHNDYQPTYLSETWSKILGLPRMRQVRAKNTKKDCFYPHSFVNKFVISKSHCLHKYGLDKEDDRDYLGSWINPDNSSVSNNFTDTSGFTYQSVTDPWIYSSYGELNTYGAGGYTLNFYSEEQLPNSTKRIDILERSSWLDENTWALIVEMTTFNSDVDLFCSISVVFEISHLGPINTTLWIHSYKLPVFKELSKREKFVYIAVGYILVFYIIDEFCVVERQRLKYIKTVANLINFGIKGVCLFFLLQLAFKFKLASSLTELYLLQPDEFIPFHKVSHVDKTLRITLGFLAFLIVLKTLRYSRFFYDVRLAQRSILAALPGICSMALVVAVYFFVYMAFGYLVFGQYEWNYNTMTHSAQTVFSYCVSAFKDTAFTSNRVLGGLFLASFMMVMICVLINLFQAVIMSAYEDMKQPVYEEPSDEAEVVNFLFNKVRRIWFFITCRKGSTADTELFNRVLFGHPERRNTHHLGLKARKINGRKMVYLVI
ncbi:polycystic kidney disease and receptor for egg jelly-related protein-like [Sceloporus undulatus]|uniref:polycystic kidney disease and receptor for egg jelly-related protein-like n=1 Tax=Sceloporus undulatus TaxID=8520 RepID=UPI001C4C6DA2|nr:polycystic kidney disease and receptor for egg jelly-related protein-like [Sceloporus undulatus]